MVMTVESIAAEISSIVANGYSPELAAALTRFEGGGIFEDLSFFAPLCDDHYSRKLVWLDPNNRFMILGCTWGPGQHSALHDHGGFWGAELVVSGTMEETVYELREREGDQRFRFARGASRLSSKGAVGVIVPPREYHAFGNPSSEVARTLHVYGGDLTRCHLFNPADTDWWVAQAVDLLYDV
jgi:predicted metal-dependent enzyme (double-stranded beta helix superfamily)